MARKQTDKSPQPATAKTSVRIDKWLWAARCFKTRSLSGEACAGGKVKINGKTAKASSSVKPGDLIEALTPGGPRVLRVEALAERRGPASVAQTLFDDLTPEPEPRPERQLPPLLRNRGAGRPTKRERRQIDRFLRDDDW
jgi:ribosome-associated heat shock protein Hsp15